MNMTINGQAVTPLKSDGTPAEVFAYDGATYVPLRYLSETLGIQVEWDPAAPNTAKLVSDKITVPAAPSGGLKDGTYTGEAQGYGGAVTATITVSGGKITDCVLEGKNETPAIGGAALPTLKEQVIAAGSDKIDGYTGATGTTTGVKNAVAAALALASGSAPAGEETESALKSTETDVLVIGGGGAGLSAALAAKQGGAKVILVEKLAALGGNTFRCGGAFNTYDPEGQAKVPMTEALGTTVEKVLAHENVNEDHAALKAEVQKQWDEYKASGKTALFDSPEWHALQTLDAGDYEGNVTMIRTLTSNALDTLHWLADNGVTWTDEVSTVVGALWNRSHQTPKASGAEIVAALESNARQSGVEIYLNTKAEELVVENGNVTGAKITNANGETVTVKAAKGVILATGGFSANVEMREKYNKQWDYIGEKLPTNNTPGATGDGITMGEAVGANLVGMGWIQLMPLNTISGGGISGYVNSSAFINKEGKRFVAEDARRDVLAAAVLKQTDQMFYIVCDAKEAELRGVDKQRLDYMVSKKMIYSGNTIAELAANIGVPAAELEKSVAEFNKLVKADKPDEYGRTLWENTIEVGPFYAPAFSPAVHHTMGGLEINTQAEVLNTSGQVIKGLYAAGEVTGGIHGTNRVGGNAVPDALCFGKIAGTNAAGK